MINILCNRRSTTGRDLARALKHVPERGVVNWTGATCPDTRAGLPVLNYASRTDKLAQLVRLDHQGVKVPPYATALPRGGRGELWAPRTIHHQQGRDFTRRLRPQNADYYVKILPLRDEWRLHFFRTTKGNYKLLRSGLKIPKVARPHPWVKSHRLGWKLSYIGGAPSSLVEEGRKAMKALNLDFGAVDIADNAQGEPVVLEVNTCPGLEGGTLERYVQAIRERFQQ